MSNTLRRNSRELALQLLFESEFNASTNPAHTLELSGGSTDPLLVNYADEILCGVRDNLQAIDSKIQSAAAKWKMERMASVDRNILRMAVFEMFFAKEKITPNIAINEALEIAKRFGNTDSAGFINGVLDQTVKRTNV